MAYPDKINALVDVTADETLAAGGHAARHNDANEALEELEAVFTAPATDELALRPDGSTEAVRIDSSGNVGIGTTSPGALLDVDGSAQTQSLLVSDVSDMEFRIANDAGSPLSGDPYNLGVGSSAGRYVLARSTQGMFNQAFLLASDVSTNADSVFSISTSSDSGSTWNNRFKVTHGGDVYAPGGVFLGGSAAANELDDYEEGTWTPVLSGSTTAGTYTLTTTGDYTKIGNVVTIQGSFTVTAIPTAGTGLLEMALPFTAISGFAFTQIRIANFNVNFAGSVGANWGRNSGSDKAALYYTTDTTGAHTAALTTAIKVNSSCWFSGTYITNS